MQTAVPDILRVVHAAAAGTTGEVEVSVVMPCLNEARTVVRCVEKARHAFEGLGLSGEVVVADNGSTDGSPELAQASICGILGSSIGSRPGSRQECSTGAR